MNYFIIILSLAASFSVHAQICKTNITPDTPDSRFKLYNNGTAFDKKTGLTWMRCALGQTWESTAKTCSGQVNEYVWEDALNAAESQSFASFNDWRIPNIKELNSIVEGRCYEPAINLIIFPGETGNVFWSASPRTSKDNYYGPWEIDFNYGHGVWILSGYYAVRLVRGGQ